MASRASSRGSQVDGPDDLSLPACGQPRRPWRARPAVSAFRASSSQGSARPRAAASVCHFAASIEIAAARRGRRHRGGRGGSARRRCPSRPRAGTSARAAASSLRHAVAVEQHDGVLDLGRRCCRSSRPAPSRAPPRPGRAARRGPAGRARRARTAPRRSPASAARRNSSTARRSLSGVAPAAAAEARDCRRPPARRPPRGLEQPRRPAAGSLAMPRPSSVIMAERDRPPAGRRAARAEAIPFRGLRPILAHAEAAGVELAEERHRRAVVRVRLDALGRLVEGGQVEPALVGAIGEVGGRPVGRASSLPQPARPASSGLAGRRSSRTTATRKRGTSVALG